MATESGPFEDVSPIENGDFNCHISSPEGNYPVLIPTGAGLFCSAYRVAISCEAN